MEWSGICEMSDRPWVLLEGDVIRSSDIRVALRFLSRVIKDTARTVCRAYLTYDKLGTAGRYVRHGELAGGSILNDLDGYIGAIRELLSLPVE